MAALEISPHRTEFVQFGFAGRPRRRDPDAMAASVARLTAEHGMPVDQVASYWGVQKGIEFVKKLLSAPAYQWLPPQEREHVLQTARTAINEHLVGARPNFP